MRRRLLTLVLSFGPLSFVPILAQDVKPTLTLRTTTGATRFHLGERISLTLTLTGPGNGKYSIDTASYDRSGRLNIDTFDASPNDGWADPLATYFSQGSFDGGGLRGAEVLSPKPVSLLADLNEHIRFDRPGAYTVTATSNRVGTPSKDSSLPGEPFFSLVSNPIQIEILPATPEWQAQKLRSILAVLAVPFKAKRFEALPAETTNAIADLRFLNSPASIELLASYLREGDSDESNNLKWAAAFGLAGVPNSMRDIALHAMSRQLEDPAFPVTEFFLTIMACLEPAPHSTKCEFLAANRPGFRPAWQIALADLPRKQGPALAVTADTLLSNTPDGEDSEVKARLAEAVAKSFTLLPLDRQIWDLQYNWKDLSRQPMVQVLQAVLREASSEVRTPFHTPGDLTGLALKRWYELDPEGALRELPILLAEPGIEFSPGAIASLPDNPQPQFEGSWARELLESRDEERETVLAALLVRFGTGSALTQVEQKASTLGDVSGCAPQAAALAYLVKFNSMKAGSLLERALKEPHWQSCPANLFTMVSRFAQGPALNEAAIAAIQYPDTAVAADAARYLRYFGMDSARGPLLERYRRWSDERAAKPNESDPDSGPNAMFSELGQRLGEALIGGQGWLTDAALTEEVVKRCSGEMMCRQLKDLSDAAAAPALHVNVNHDPTEERYWIGPYSSKTRELFEAKLDQFPKGTKFVLTPIWKSGDEIQIRTQTEELFKKHGMILEDAPNKNAAATR